MELDRNQILDALANIAFAKPNDAISLALNPDAQRVPNLNLWAVSEFKLTSTGNVELKFADRVKAISLLLDCTSGCEDSMNALLEALEANP